jgi:hypothetical protein
MKPMRDRGRVNKCGVPGVHSQFRTSSKGGALQVVVSWQPTILTLPASPPSIYHQRRGGGKCTLESPGHLHTSQEAGVGTPTWCVPPEYLIHLRAISAIDFVDPSLAGSRLSVIPQKFSSGGVIWDRIYGLRRIKRRVFRTQGNVKE